MPIKDKTKEAGMKLTPEQKALLAYGEARGILKERKSLMRFTEGFGECSDYHGEPRIMYGVEEAIRDAWQKRAACRAWVPIAERDCPNCKYHNLLTKQSPCRECYPHEDQRLWEPRKEGGGE